MKSHNSPRIFQIHTLIYYNGCAYHECLEDYTKIIIKLKYQINILNRPTLNNWILYHADIFLSSCSYLLEFQTLIKQGLVRKYFNSYIKCIPQTRTHHVLLLSPHWPRQSGIGQASKSRDERWRGRAGDRRSALLSQHVRPLSLRMRCRPRPRGTLPAHAQGIAAPGPEGRVACEPVLFLN